MPLKNRNNFPPNGYMFYQPETGWSSNPWDSFDGVVAQIIAHRKGNPRFNLSVDPGQVAAELETYTVARISGMPGADQYLSGPAGAAPPSFPSPPRRRVEAVAGGVANAVAGASLLLDWLGDGLNPVDQATAEQRASVCVRCPNNQKPNLLQSGYSFVASGLHLLMNERANRNLKTSHDAQLHTCIVCSCDLKLKVFAPMNHVNAHTTPEVRAKLWPECWILQKG